MTSSESGQSQRLRVVVGDDDLLVRRGVHRMLSATRDIDVVASCSDRATVLRAVRSTCPDVLVTDVRMRPTMSDEGVSLAHELAGSMPEVGVLVLTAKGDATHARRLLSGCASKRGYLLKQATADPSRLPTAVRSVAAGNTVVDAPLLAHLVDERPAPVLAADRLTAREHEVLEAMSVGMTNAAIADRLSVTVRAVEKHITSIFAKLELPTTPDVHRRVLAVLAHRR